MRLNPILEALSPFSYCGTGYPVRLDANESCLPLPEAIAKEIAAGVAKLDLSRYPDDKTVALRRAFADAFSVDADCVVPGNGSDELINMLVGRVAPPDGVVLGVELDFGSYWSNAAIFGRRAVKIARRDDLSFTADDLIEAAGRHKADLVIFSNPNNPSGGVLPRGEVVRLVESVNCMVAVDEAYMDFSNESVLDLAGRYENLLVLRTLSKAMGAAGARLGFCVSTPRLTDAMRSVRDAYNVSAVDQLVGTVLLRHPEHRERTLAETARLMRLMKSRLDAVAVRVPGMRVYPSHANFVLIRLSDARRVWEQLHREGISLRLFGEELLRVSTAPQPVLERVLDRLEAIII